MQIERVNHSNLKDVIALFDLYRVFYGKKSDITTAERFLTERTDKNESVIFLARNEGSPAGFVQLYPSFSSVSMKREWILNDLFVHPDFRKRGIAKELLEQAKKLGRETESKGLLLETGIDNKEAQQLYESTGWEKNNEFFVYTIRLDNE